MRGQHNETIQHVRWLSVALLCTCLALASCGDDEGSTTTDAAGGTTTGGAITGGTTGGTNTGGTTGGSATGGSATGGSTTGGVTGGMTMGGTTGGATGGTTMVEDVMISGDINGADNRWTADKRYILTDIIYVEEQATLTIEPGTTVLGQEGSALIVRAGGRLIADGTADAPIIFTSAKETGTRAPSDWGGVALLGFAPVNEGTNDPGFNNGEMVLEGIADASRVVFGGMLTNWNCGTLRYVRIEFAGFKLNQNDELNGLTLGGCGSGTVIDYVQVHKGSDDGVEIFGGTVGIRHVVISEVEDDSLDWDRGWVGGGQFIAIYQGDAGDNGIEADSGDDLNEDDINDATPIAQPILYNMTIAANSVADWGIVFKAGTAGSVRNSIIMGQAEGGIDIQGTDTAGNTMMGATTPLTVENTIFWGHGMNNTPFPAEAEDDDGGLDEDMYFRDPSFNNIFMDPGLTDLATPTPTALVPRDGMTAATTTVPAPIGESNGFNYDTSATFPGAFAPGNASWAEGWTAFPQN